MVGATEADVFLVYCRTNFDENAHKHQRISAIIYPIEKVIRDIRLTQIWTGTNEIMSLLIQHEYYHDVLAGKEEVRNLELDATSHNGNSEKCYTDEDMWKLHEG